MGRPTLFLSAISIIILIVTIVIAYMEGKTPWDVLELLVIPLILAIGAFFFNWSQKDYELGIAEEARKTDRDIAADRQRETLLQNYLDRMAELLLKENLLEKRDSAGDPVLDVAKVRTITAIKSLDKNRRNIIFQFLRDAKLIDFILINAPLSEADLNNANLYKANLSEAILYKADLDQAHMVEANLDKALLAYANLSEAGLYKANLSGANLYEAILYKAHLGSALLSDAELMNADLRRVNLIEADMIGANLSGANLEGSYLIKANLSKTILTDANLDGADLTGAKVTKRQLDKARSLKGATMPDGTVHE